MQVCLTRGDHSYTAVQTIITLPLRSTHVRIELCTHTFDSNRADHDVQCHW